MSKKCPKCGLINPDTAYRCDCGYNFETRKVETPYPKRLEERENQLQEDKDTRIEKVFGIGGIFVGATVVWPFLWHLWFPDTSGFDWPQILVGALLASVFYSFGAAIGTSIAERYKHSHPTSKIIWWSAGAVLLIILFVRMFPIHNSADTSWEDYAYAGIEAMEQARYAKAEELFLTSLKEAEQFGNEDPRLGTALNNLAELYRAQGRYTETEPLYHRALAINEKVLGPEHPNVAGSLNNLAELYRQQGNNAEAEPLYQRALAIWEKTVGLEDPLTARSLTNLGLLYQDQGKYLEAEPLYRRALSIQESVLGPEHPDVARSLNNLGTLYHEQRKYAEAEPLYLRALAMNENVLGPDHPDTARDLNNMAMLYHDQGKYGEAEPLYRRSLAILQEVLGLDHPRTATILENYATLLRVSGHNEEAKRLVLNVDLLKMAQKGETALVETLLSIGADANAKTESGLSALMVATQAGHTEIVELLKKAGAKE